MKELTVYYSVVDAGDGSAYSKFFANKALAKYHQANDQAESWAEECIGSITFEGDNLSCNEAETKESYYLELFLDGWENENEVQKFVATFFPNGLPKFDVNILDDTYYEILLEGKVVCKQFSHPRPSTEEGRLALLEKLNTTAKENT